MSLGKGFVYGGKSSRNYSGFDMFELSPILLGFSLEEGDIGVFYSGDIEVISCKSEENPTTNSPALVIRQFRDGITPIY